MSKPWYYTIGYPVKVLHNRTWKSAMICNGYRHEDGIISTRTEDGELVWFGEAQKDYCLRPNLPDDNQWIPATERLPQDGQKIWVTKEYRGGERRVELSLFVVNDFEAPGYSGIVCTDLVKAWMPYFKPEPYKEES